MANRRARFHMYSVTGRQTAGLRQGEPVRQARGSMQPSVCAHKEAQRQMNAKREILGWQLSAEMGIVWKVVEFKYADRWI